MNKNHPCLTETNLPLPNKHEGKVRDTYDMGNNLVLVTTDRLSAFDRVLCAVPHKGQVLNLCSAWWFQQTKDILPNHVIAVPHPNITIAKKCQVFPVEFVVRGYITGSTSTSLWNLYQQGQRQFGELCLSDNLAKNARLPFPILTPTTKSDMGDRPITAAEIMDEGFMTATQWAKAKAAAIQLFQFGCDIARQRGLILVDTKYEMGLDECGQLTLVDEVHTPDSSRYWLADTYEKRYQQGLEPESIDKEFIRLWFKSHCDPYRDKVLPQPPNELIQTLSHRYIKLYERITGKAFQSSGEGETRDEPMADSIRKALSQSLQRV